MIAGIDHFVLTVASLDRTLDFYERVLDMKRSVIVGRPASLLFGTQKINVHQRDKTFEPKATLPTPGSADFCLVSTWPIAAILERLAAEGIQPELGPVMRNGARGPMTSIYFRDPDGNLVEVSYYG